MLPGDRLICTFVKPQKVGTQFSTWLLHVTVVPWFRLPDDSTAVACGLTRTLATIEPFEARGDEQATFGPRKNRPATLIEQPSPFIQIEQKVRMYFHKKRAWLVDETTKRPHQFLPHVTAQGDHKVNTGDVFLIDRLYIVEQHGEYKEVVCEVPIGKAAT